MSQPPTESARSTTAALRRLGSGGRDDQLRFTLVLRLLLRCLPLLRGVRRHLLLFCAIAMLAFAVLLPLGLMAVDVFWTGVLQGQPLPEIQARLLFLDPALASTVDALDDAVRRTIRDRLFLMAAGITLGLTLPLVGVLTWYYVWITQRINQDLRLRLVDRLQLLSLRFHAEHRVGDAIYRVHQDSAMVSDLIEALFLTPLSQLGRHFLAAGAIALFDPLLAAIYLLCWPPMLWIGWAVSRRLRIGFRDTRESNAALTARIQELLAGIRVLKAYGAEPQAQASFVAHSRRAFDAAFGARDLVCLFSIATFVIASTAVLAATGFALDLTRRDEPLAAAGLLAAFGLTTWTLGSFNFLKGELGWATTSMRILFRMWARLQDMAIGLDRVFELLDLEPEVRDAPDAIEMPELRHGVAFRDVEFGYRPGEPVLRGISFEAPPGSVTAIVGPTGSGKSTLVSLLLRLFDPERGAIEIDGVDLRQIRVASLREHVAIALQENLLFGASVRDNVQYAAPHASEAELREALRVACADEFVARLPQGFDTLLGERGAKLSTGQRQRLSIARALAKDTPILILDEPTAALDAETELRLLDNLAAWGRGRAIFLVTHRLSTIRRADQIMVLEDGRLVDRGSHAELVARLGAYRRLVESEDPDLPPARRAAP
jgi:ABC-type multidrug transport system fused ATPase/permease subunit